MHNVEQLVAIDPGTTESGYVIMRPDLTVIGGDVVDNGALISLFADLDAQACVIEMIQSMGMPIGKSTLETVVWVGMFMREWDREKGSAARRLYRPEIKAHLTGSARSKDANVRAALVDRYGGSDKAAKGTKKAPGPLYGFRSHMWQALAVGVTYSELYHPNAQPRIAAF